MEDEGQWLLAIDTLDEPKVSPLFDVLPKLSYGNANYNTFLSKHRVSKQPGNRCLQNIR